MRLGRIFWGVVLIVLGGLFFLQNTGLISDVFGWFGPIFLILLGVWVLMRRNLPRTASKDDFSIDLQGAAQVAFDLDHGAGSVQLSSGAPAGVAITGTQGEGIEVKSHLVGDRLDVDIDAGPGFIPFIGPDDGVWRFRLGQGVPTTLDVDAGATSLDFDLNDLNITSMKFDLGASTLKLKMPASVAFTHVEINSGAATLDLNIPQGVALRLRTTLGASSFDIDQSRFPLQSSGFYQSADYESAANKAEINLDGGANTVKVW
jgi:hypothetical protein